jgi:hypothetical protein
MLLLSARKEKLGEKGSIWYHQEKENGSNTISGHSRTPKLRLAMLPSSVSASVSKEPKWSK